MSIKHARPRPAREAAARAAILTLVVIAAGLVPTGLAAQQERIDSPFRWREKGFRLGFFGGYHAANRGALEFGQGPAMAAGTKLRVRVSSPLSLELGATYVPAQRWVQDLLAEGGPAVVDTVDAGWLRADIAAQVSLTGARTWHGIQPYGLFGGGFVFGINEGASEALADPTLEGFRYDISTAPQLHLGLGFEVFPTSKIGIGFEARDYLIRLTAPDGFLLQEVLDAVEAVGGPAPQKTSWGHNLEFGILLWYYF